LTTRLDVFFVLLCLNFNLFCRAAWINKYIPTEKPQPGKLLISIYLSFYLSDYV
jgi:hypothetical protein